MDKMRADNATYKRRQQERQVLIDIEASLRIMEDMYRRLDTKDFLVKPDAMAAIRAGIEMLSEELKALVDPRPYDE